MLSVDLPSRTPDNCFNQQLKGVVINDTSSSKINVLNETDHDSDISTSHSPFQESNLVSLKDLNINGSNNEINKITWREPQKLYYQRASPPDILFRENHDNFQNKIFCRIHLWMGNKWMLRTKYFENS